MKKAATETAQAMQRVKVGTIGLFAIVLLIAIANTLLGSADRERPVDALKADAVANLSSTNTTAATEPLAELGVTPAADANSVAPARR